MVPFIFKKTVSMILFTNCCLWNFFFFWRVSVFPLHKLSFPSEDHSGIHIIQPSLNFVWFALVSLQNFDDRHLFKPGVPFDLLPFWIALGKKWKKFFSIFLE